MIRKLKGNEFWEQVSYIGYYILFAVFYGGKYIFEEMQMNLVGYILLLLAYICLSAKILFTKYSVAEYMTGAVLLVLAVISFYVNRNLYLPTNLLLIFSLKNVKLEDFFRKCFWIALFTVVVTMGLSIVGVGGTLAVTKDWGRGVEETRYVFGYGFPNTCHMYLLRLIMIYVLGYYSEIRLWHVIILFGLNVFLYIFTISRTGLIGIGGLLAYMILLKIMPKISVKLWFGVLVALLYVLIGGSVCYLIFEMKETEWFARLDSLLTWRLTLATEHIMENSIRIFGQNYGDVYIDCGWISMLLQWGPIWFFLYHGAMIILILKSTLIKKPQIAMVILITGIYGICESSVMEKGVAAISVILISLLLRNEKTEHIRIEKGK